MTTGAGADTQGTKAADKAADKVAEHAKDGQHSNQKLAAEIHRDLQHMNPQQRHDFYAELRKDAGGGSGDVHLPHIMMHDGPNGDGQITVYKGKGHHKETIDAKTGDSVNPAKGGGTDTVKYAPDGKTIVSREHEQKKDDGSTETTKLSPDGKHVLGKDVSTPGEGGSTVTKHYDAQGSYTGSSESQPGADGTINTKNYGPKGEDLGGSSQKTNPDGSVDTTNFRPDGSRSSESIEDPKTGEKTTQSFGPDGKSVTGTDIQTKNPDGSTHVESYGPPPANDKTGSSDSKTNPDGTVDTTNCGPDGTRISSVHEDPSKGSTETTQYGKDGKAIVSDTTVVKGKDGSVETTVTGPDGSWASHKLVMPDGTTIDTEKSTKDGSVDMTVTGPDGKTVVYKTHTPEGGPTETLIPKPEAAQPPAPGQPQSSSDAPAQMT